MLRSKSDATPKCNLLSIVLITGVFLPPLRASAAEQKIPPAPSHLKGYEKLYQESPRDAALRWFRDAKYGLFMHFGLYSLDGIGVRYQMGRALKPYWDFDPIPVKEYEKLMHRWKIEKFDADFIADLAVKSGMKYITITAKHSDGFCLWDSKSDSFNSMNSAAKRDVIGELAAACKNRGLGFFPFYEIGYECRHPHGLPQGRVPYEKYTGRREPHYAYGDELDPTKYVDAVHEHVRELLAYDIAGIWLDGYGVTKDKAGLFRLQELYGMIHRSSPYCLVANKHGPTGTEDFIDTEGHINAPGTDRNYDRNAAQGKKIEVCKSMAGGWGWHHPDHFLPGERYDWPPERLWDQLKMYNTLDVNLLLNIGPRWDGGIEPDQVAVLLETGSRIRREGFPKGKGLEADAIRLRSQTMVDKSLLRRIHSREFGPLKARLKKLSKQKGSTEYRELKTQLDALTDLDSFENQKLLDDWYEKHPAGWFRRYKE